MLLSWWEFHGRYDIPWKRFAQDFFPKRGEELNPYPIWVAEVVVHSCLGNSSIARVIRWIAKEPCNGWSFLKPDGSLLESA